MGVVVKMSGTEYGDDDDDDDIDPHIVMVLMEVKIQVTPHNEDDDDDDDDNDNNGYTRILRNAGHIVNEPDSPGQPGQYHTA